MKELEAIETGFKVAIIAVVYIIIVFALIVMYKDIKNGGKKKKSKKRYSFGLEVIEPGENTHLKSGGVIPINSGITIGRKEDNVLKLLDNYVSGHHAKIFIKNTDYILEDLGSTNGTFLNSNKVEGRTTLSKGDIIQIGSSIFKVIA